MKTLLLGLVLLGTAGCSGASSATGAAVATIDPATPTVSAPTGDEMAAAERAYRAACTAHGGTPTVLQYPDLSPRPLAPGNLTCLVSYPPEVSDQVVTLNPDGTFDQASANAAQQDCSGNAQDAASAAQDEHPWSVQPTYHADTGVCVRGHA